MDKLSIKDRTFAHSKLGYCSDFQKSEIFEWDRNNISGDIVYTDMVLGTVTHNPSGNNYAWLIEPVDISKRNYDTIDRLKGKYSRVFTHEKTLIDNGAPYEFVPFGCCWIKPEDQKIWAKSKYLSIISSHKTSTDGHNLRHRVINSHRHLDNFDVYGRKYNPLDYKLDGLKDYMFHVVIENCKRDYWFTEKLIDCLVTGTVPIYWGCPSIGDFFDIRGFIIVDDIEDISNVIDLVNILTEERYNEMLPYIEKNFELAKKYLLPDEWVYKKIKSI